MLQAPSILNTKWLRLGGTAAVLAVCLWFLAGQVAHFDGAEIAARLRGLAPWQWGLALGAVALAFYAVARQERVILRHMGLSPDRRHATAASMAVAGVSQSVGLGPVVGAMLRARLMPGVGMKQSFLVSAATTIGFFSGAGVVMLAFLALRGSVLAGLGLGLVLGAIALRSLRAELAWRGWRLPSAATALSLLAWVAVDLAALSFAFWVLLPQGHGHGWAEVGTAFMLALALGLMTGSPAGTGPFEALVLVQLPAIAPEALVAGLLAFRGAAYAVPAALGAGWVLVGPRLMPHPRPLPAEPVGPEAAFTAPDRAEVLLSRQGDLQLMRDAAGQVWTSIPLGRHRVLVGEPATRPGLRRSLAPFLAACRHEGRPPLLYKVGPREAVAARAEGLVLLRLAQEAVIIPASHRVEGSAHAGLRRKLRHAAKAGVRVRGAGSLPLEAMAEVAADWAARHGGERGLTTGRWSADYVAGQRVFLAEDAEGRLLAFATFHATAQDWVLDLVRFRAGAPDGTLYLIVQTAIEVARDEGVGRFSLAAVPTEGFGLPFPLGRLARPFSAKARGLRQFKDSFAPSWQPRYAAAPGWVGLLGGLLLMALAIRLPRTPGRSPGAPPEARRRWAAEMRLWRARPPAARTEARQRRLRR